MDIHVWSVGTGGQESDVYLLPDEERRRAELLRAGKQRIYVAARIALWQLLTSALGCSQSDMRIDHRCRHCGDPDHGKPTLVGIENKVDFSVSYSSELALIAIGFSTNVGVDIQEVVPGSQPHRWCFSTLEQQYLTRLDDEQRDHATTRSWARKEALAKADGRGLALPLSSVVTTGPAAQWILPSRRWRVQDLDVAGGFAAAVAYDAPSSNVRFMSWSNDGPRSGSA